MAAIAAVTVDRTKAEEALRAAYDTVRVALSEEQRKTWTLSKTDKKAGVECFQRPAPGGGRLPQFLAVGTVRGLTAEESTRRVLEGGERRESWNPIHDATTVLDEWETATGDGCCWHCRVIHECHKQAVGGLVSPRDFVKATARFNTAAAAESWFVYVSVNPAEVTPGLALQSSFTHATSFPSGTRAVQAPGSDAEHPAALMHTLVHADPAGSVPAFVIPKGTMGELVGFFVGANKAFSA